MSFSKISVLGPGVLGGSLGLAASAHGYDVSLWGRSAEKVAAACAIGLNATTDLAEAVSEADLIVLAVPVGVMSSLCEQFKGHLKPSAIVTDVGSVKSLPHEMAAAHQLAFIGSHPMAGSEQGGIEAAQRDLFQGAACVITNDADCSQEEVAHITSFWDSLGCRTSHMAAEAHDRAVARISHMPHAMAVATAAAGLTTPSDHLLSAGGFRDTTRVASGDPSMWAEIMMENRTHLTAALHDAQNEIREMLEHLINSDQKGLQKYLAEVKFRKENPDTLS